MNEFDGRQTIVSHSGTRHLVADGTIGIGHFRVGGRITTQCAMNLKPDADTTPRAPSGHEAALGPFIATHNCPFCAAQLRYASRIRALFLVPDVNLVLPLRVLVADAALALEVSEEEIRNAVAGSPDLLWDPGGIAIRLLNGINPTRR